METPNFYAVIPATVRYDPELSSTAKLLYGEITALATKEGYCYASNQYFAELYGAAERTIQRTLQQLAQKGYCRIVTISGYRRIYVPEGVTKMSQGDTEGVTKMSPDDKNVTPGVTKMSRGGDKNVTLSNTKNNTREIIDEYIETYTTDDTLRESLYDFVRARQEMKKPLSEMAFDRLLKKLTTLADTDEERRLIVEESIERGWQGFFPLKDKPAQSTTYQPAPRPQAAPARPAYQKKANFFNDYEHQSSYDWDKIQAELEANPTLKFSK